MLKKRCVALCKNSKRCKKKVFSGCCNIHKNHEICTICLNNCTFGSYKTLGCTHIFCKSCIYTWIIPNNTCPNCRTYVTSSEYSSAFNYNIKSGNIINIYSHVVYISRGILTDFIKTHIHLNQWISEEKWDSVKNLFNRIHTRIYNRTRTGTTLYTYMTLSDYHSLFKFEFPDISYTIIDNNKVIDRYIIKTI